MTILTVTIHDEVLSKVMFSSRILFKNVKFQKKISNLNFCSVTNYNLIVHKMRSLLAHNLGKNIKKTLAVTIQLFKRKLSGQPQNWRSILWQGKIICSAVQRFLPI